MKSKIFAVVALLFIYGCSTVPLTGRRQLNIISDQEILSLSNQSYTSYINSAKKSTNVTQSTMVKSCGKRIQNAVETYLASQGASSQIAGYQWEFVLTEDNSINAFCMPGGKVVVYTGILPYTKTEAGLAVVLGHEIAHAVAKHSNERLSHQMLVQAGGSLLGTAIGNKSATFQSVVNSVYGLGSNVGILLPFSREQEYEADKLGLIFMAMAGYDPTVAIDFWTRMAQSGSSTTPEFLSTHPADAKRINAIKNIMPEVLKYKK
ncbi:MAG: M48 family metallopeptidase [Bacteroidales bacterium]|nr:M48 family metallopeptidase [Bacteroidales bacterium]